MTSWGVDASEAVKWMLPEPLAAEAAHLQSPAHSLNWSHPVSTPTHGYAE